MKKKEKKKQGFAITGVLYSILLLFVVMLIGILNNLEGRKQLLDVMKEDTIKASESDEAIKDLYEQVSQLKKQLIDTNTELINVKEQVTIVKTPLGNQQSWIQFGDWNGNYVMSTPIPIIRSQFTISLTHFEIPYEYDFDHQLDQFKIYYFPNYFIIYSTQELLAHKSIYIRYTVS